MPVSVTVRVMVVGVKVTILSCRFCFDFFGLFISCEHAVKLQHSLV